MQRGSRSSRSQTGTKDSNLLAAILDCGHDDRDDSQEDAYPDERLSLSNSSRSSCLQFCSQRTNLGPGLSKKDPKTSRGFGHYFQGKTLSNSTNMVGGLVMNQKS